jgi:hypothetical protein
LGLFVRSLASIKTPGTRATGGFRPRRPRIHI